MEREVIKINKYESEMKWIGIDKSLPEYEEPVLVCESHNQDSVCICRLDSKTENKEGATYSWLMGKTGYDEFYHNVTHWMPLPIVHSPELD